MLSRPRMWWQRLHLATVQTAVGGEAWRRENHVDHMVDWDDRDCHPHGEVQPEGSNEALFVEGRGEGEPWTRVSFAISDEKQQETDEDRAWWRAVGGRQMGWGVEIEWGGV